MPVPLIPAAGAVGQVAGFVGGLFGGGGPPAGTVVEYGAVIGRSFAENIRNVPTDVLERSLLTGENPFNPSSRDRVKADGLVTIRAELDRRRAQTVGAPASPPAVSYAAPGAAAVAPAQAGSLSGWLPVLAIIGAIVAAKFFGKR